MTERKVLSESQLRELLLETYLEMQDEQEEAGIAPSTRHHMLERLRPTFETIGAIQVGLLIACLTIFMNFIVLTMILHLDIPLR